MRAPLSKHLSKAAIAAAAAAISLSLGATAKATTYFDASASPGAIFKATDLLFTGFSFGYYDVRFAGQCSACVTASTPGGAPLGVFNFSMNGLPWSYLEDPSVYPAATTHSAIPGYGGYYERFEGYGMVDIAGQTGAPLISSDFDAVEVFAKPGSSEATLQFELYQPSSGLVSLPASGPLYLIITAATASPIELANLTPGAANPLYTFETPITFDYDVTLTNTPFAGLPNPMSGVPEPSLWAMLLVGFAGLGALLRSRRSTGAASLPA